MDREYRFGKYIESSSANLIYSTSDCLEGLRNPTNEYSMDNQNPGEIFSSPLLNTIHVVIHC